MDSEDRNEQVDWLVQEAADLYDNCQVQRADYPHVTAFATALVCSWQEQCAEDGTLPRWYGVRDWAFMVDIIDESAS